MYNFSDGACLEHFEFGRVPAGQALRSNLFCKRVSKKGFSLQSFTRTWLNISIMALMK